MGAFEKIRDRKERARQRRKRSIRKRIAGTPERPRLSVFRSLNHIYAQAIDDTTRKVLASSSDLEKSVLAQVAGKKKRDRAKLVGSAIAKKLLEQNVRKVVFDRNGFIYHGRVREVAVGAREAGLEF